MEQLEESANKLRNVNTEEKCAVLDDVIASHKDRLSKLKEAVKEKENELENRNVQSDELEKKLQLLNEHFKCVDDELERTKSVGIDSEKIMNAYDRYQVLYIGICMYTKTTFYQLVEMIIL